MFPEIFSEIFLYEWMFLTLTVMQEIALLRKLNSVVHGRLVYLSIHSKVFQICATGLLPLRLLCAEFNLCNEMGERHN